VILSSEKFIADHLHTFLRQTGPALSPFMHGAVEGIETLPLRIEKMQQNAAKLADFIGEQKQIKKVIYPFRDDHPQVKLAKKQMKGGGTLFSFEVPGGKAAAFRFANALRLIRISNNPAMRRACSRIPPRRPTSGSRRRRAKAWGSATGFSAFPVGLEHADDLAEDLTRGLKAL